MHIEPPDKPLTRAKDFLRHYVMIVVSILTALALEQVALAVHHRQAANYARAAVAAELKANVTDLRKSLEANERVLASASALYKDFLTAARAGSQADQLAVLRRERVIGLNLPSLRSDAWTSAIANQAINYLQSGEQQQLSERYTTQRDIVQAVSNQILYSDLLSQMAEVQFAADVGRVNTQSVGRSLVRYASVVQEANSELRQLLLILESSPK